MEAIHIQLSDKRSIVVMFEELWNQGFRKLVLVKDDEGVAVVGPANEFSILTLV